MTLETTDMQSLSRIARKSILDKLEKTLNRPQDPFKVSETMGVRRPHLTPVTQVEENSPEQLAILFGEQLKAVSGSYHIVREGEGVADAVLRHISQIHKYENNPECKNKILSWNPDVLNVSDLSETLERNNVELVVPNDLHEETCRTEASSIRVGITGVEAAMATTGTVSLGNGPGMNRAASLLPLHHILLVPQERLYQNVESWFEELRKQKIIREVLCDRSQLSLVTGPSKSADIELTLTLGVHGPRTVHAIIYRAPY
jgi:L-lactate dehydrogenase complex protein LldG